MSAKGGGLYKELNQDIFRKEVTRDDSRASCEVLPQQYEWTV